MKVLPFKIPKPSQDAFYFQIDEGWTFYDQLHQHEEIQLSFIEQGEGSLLVGDKVNQYGPGDIVVIGGHLPHVFKSGNGSNPSRMLSLLFTKASFGPGFFELEELNELHPFFDRCLHGFKIQEHEGQVREYFLQLPHTSKLGQLILLMQILKVAGTARFERLSSFIPHKQYTDMEGKRMRRVFEYTMNHFTEGINLESVAREANLTKNAFCKYFKKRTNKTYFQFLNELRLEHACKLLSSREGESIAEVAEKSGFINISNFNRQFKSRYHTTPLIFKKNSSSHEN